MARKAKSAPALAEIEPEEISQEVPEEEPEVAEEDDEPEPSNGKAISKAAAVRDALAQGEDSPEAGVSYIKKVHGLDISKTMFSSYKAQQKSRDAKKAAPSPEPAKPGRKPTTAGTPLEGYVAPPEQPRSAVNGQPDLLAAMEAMKPLIASLGKEQAHRIIDLLG